MFWSSLGQNSRLCKNICTSQLPSSPRLWKVLMKWSWNGPRCKHDSPGRRSVRFPVPQFVVVYCGLSMQLVTVRERDIDRVIINRVSGNGGIDIIVQNMKISNYSRYDTSYHGLEKWGICILGGHDGRGSVLAEPRDLDPVDGGQFWRVFSSVADIILWSLPSFPCPSSLVRACVRHEATNPCF